VLSAQPSDGEGTEADAWARRIWSDVLA